MPTCRFWEINLQKSEVVSSTSGLIQFVKCQLSNLSYYTNSVLRCMSILENQPTEVRGHLKYIWVDSIRQMST